MPIHEYRREDGSIFERVFLAGETVPDMIDGAKKIFSRSVVKFRGKFSGGTAAKHMVTEVGPDSHVIEGGEKREIKEKNRLKEKDQEDKRRSIIQESLAGY